jgi:hypothetical protein
MSHISAGHSVIPRFMRLPAPILAKPGPLPTDYAASATIGRKR